MFIAVGMNDTLRAESEKLARSWMQHDPAWLRHYLVAGVEDPRLNVQSILSRHFLIRALFGDRFDALMDQEYSFAVVADWLLEVMGTSPDPEESASLLYALRHQADNAEGLEIPHVVARIFSELPVCAGAVQVPNYIERFLAGQTVEADESPPSQALSETFCRLWKEVLGGQRPYDAKAAPSKAGSSCLAAQALAYRVARSPTRGEAGAPAAAREERPSVVEPACGSANDYRFLHACGIARSIDYTGFDLCEKNVQNARTLFPEVKFEPGNVFEISATDKAYDLCIVHDLFEHLSLEGLEQAVREVCRVTRQGLCIGFFQMDEMPRHVVRLVDEYHWNTLSMSCMKDLFAAQDFTAQVVHIGTFLRETTGCDRAHNPNAYTFVLRFTGALGGGSKQKRGSD